MDLSENLKELRECKNLSQTDLAYTIGESLAYYNKLERKVMKPSVEILDRLASFYGITIDEIVHFNKAVLKKVAAKSVKVKTAPPVRKPAKKKPQVKKKAKAKAKGKK